MPFYDQLSRSLHLIYRYSLRKAFYARGEDRHLVSLSSSPYCPTLILAAAVIDYARPTDAKHFADFEITQHFSGGERTGFWPTMSWMMLSQAMGISGAAVDAVVL